MEETIRGETENGRGEGVARDRDEWVDPQRRWMTSCLPNFLFIPVRSAFKLSERIRETAAATSYYSSAGIIKYRLFT